jgi:Zn-dependent peptidase ImmA (M78 family)
MPATAVRTRFDQIIGMEQAFSVRQLVLLAHQFGVASEAMARRLEDLDLLPKGTWESIKDRKFDSKLEREVLGDPAPEQAPPAVPTRLAYLASIALERGVLSEGQLSDLLVVDRVELRTALSAFPPSTELIAS